MRFALQIILLFIYFTLIGQEEKSILYKTSDGYAKLMSDAPLELISAETSKLKGILKPANQTFAFQLDVTSLKGFNSALQEEHFYENYMETEVYPTAEFSGKIIEKINFKNDGSYSVRAKGILKIHGIQQERIINCQLTIANNIITVQSEFIVNLADHNITIPKLVYQKIAEEIKVSVLTILKTRENKE